MNCNETPSINVNHSVSIMEQHPANVGHATFTVFKPTDHQHQLFTTKNSHNKPTNQNTTNNLYIINNNNGIELD